MNYTKDTPVPEIPSERKRYISRSLLNLIREWSPSEHNHLLCEFAKELSPEERKYAEFWWKREHANPNWRDDDPHQNKPFGPHLHIVK